MIGKLIINQLKGSVREVVNTEVASIRHTSFQTRIVQNNNNDVKITKKNYAAVFSLRQAGEIKSQQSKAMRNTKNPSRIGAN